MLSLWGMEKRRGQNIEKDLWKNLKWIDGINDRNMKWMVKTNSNLILKYPAELEELNSDYGII